MLWDSEMNNTGIFPSQAYKARISFSYPSVSRPYLCWASNPAYSQVNTLSSHKDLSHWLRTAVAREDCQHGSSPAVLSCRGPWATSGGSFICHTVRDRILLPSGELRPGMLVNLQECPGQPHNKALCPQGWGQETQAGKPSYHLEV